MKTDFENRLKYQVEISLSAFLDLGSIEPGQSIIATENFHPFHTFRFQDENFKISI